MNPLERVGIVGAACRLPGAPDEASFAKLLSEDRCVVSDQPADRWNVERFLHPRTSERGFSYTFAGGYLPNPYDFDPAVFGMSPREAAQLDPQQRLLTEVVWEALEDARLSSSTIAGTEVGVYVGVSALDHGSLFGADVSSIESHFMTGNTLSIVANRLSYQFDLRGPSFAIDTACSSSLVAVDRAMADLLAGRIDTAIVAGVNMLLSPAPFIGFSRASMLSPTGRCRPFSAEGDGYVRAEGAVAFILRRSDIADEGSIRAYLAASDINSDGRTSGIALPGLEGQKSLLRRVYETSGLGPDDIAFVEAHGTGTVVGDPIEATAIGEVVARGRSSPLPIGSVKSNIGHLEPASGVAGMMKALIALETRHLPATLHLRAQNPHIDFRALNLQPAATAINLDPDVDVLHCGVSSFGFGGTNAHVILRSVPRPASGKKAPEGKRPDHLVISAACRDALAALAKSHADLLSSGVAPDRLATAVASGRSLLRHRAALPLSDAKSMARALNAFATGEKTTDILTGNVSGRKPRICFVYSGNGAQWVGMGRTAFARNADFAAKFAEIDSIFRSFRPQSLVDLLADANLAEKLVAAECGQPLLFAIQASLTHALAERGLGPDIVLGHSVGEIAAAHTAGILDLKTAVRILDARAFCQEAVRGTGLMAAFAADRNTIARFLATLGTGDIAIAADNGPSSVTVTGGTDAVRLAMKEARRNRLAGRLLDIDYPYHSSRLDGIRATFLDSVGEVNDAEPRLAMMSTVFGGALEGRALDAQYWWRNLRQEVLFQQAVKAAAAEGADLFIEIGPRPILVSPITTALEEVGSSGKCIYSLSETDDRVGQGGRDPVQTIIARAIANGHFPETVEGATNVVDRSLPLPPYPWQRKSFRAPHSSEALDLHSSKPRHPLIGGRLADGLPEWRTLLDTALVPYLGDHRVGDETVVPATALAEMALAVARELHPTGPIGIEDLDILQALVIPTQGIREMSIRYSEPSSAVEIYSRPRFGSNEWTLHARGNICTAPTTPGLPPQVDGAIVRDDRDDIYDAAARTGIDYGPAFTLFRRLRRDGEEVIEVDLEPAQAGTGAFSRPQILHPASLDAAFHGLFDLMVINQDKRAAWVPIRFDRLSVWRDAPSIVRAVIVVDQSSDQSKTVTLWLKDEKGDVVARLDRALLRPVTLSYGGADDALMHVSSLPCGMDNNAVTPFAFVADQLATHGFPEVSEGWLLLRAHMRAVAYAYFAGLTGERRQFDLGLLVTEGRIAPTALPFAHRLVDELRTAGLVRNEDNVDRLAEDSGLPAAELILSTFAAEYPHEATDLVFAAHAAASLPLYLGSGKPIKQRQALLTRHDARSILADPGCSAAVDAVRGLIEVMAPHIPHVLIAEPGSTGLLARLLPFCIEHRLRLTVAGSDASALGRMVRVLPEQARVETFDISSIDDTRDADLAIMCMRPFGNDQADALLASLTSRLLEGGALFVGIPIADPVLHFHQEMAIEDAEFVPPPAAIKRKLESAGCREIREFGSWAGGAVALLAAANPAVMRNCPDPLRIVTSPGSGNLAIQEGLAAQVEQRGARRLSSLSDLNSEAAGDVVLLVLPGSNDEDIETVGQAIQFIRGELLVATDRKKAPRLWIVTTGLMGDIVNPVADAIWGFSRVAMNEYAGLDIRLVDIDESMSSEDAAIRLCDLLATPGPEREVHIGVASRSVLRVRRGLPPIANASDGSGAMALDFPRRGMLENFRWIPKERTAPGRGEIEIEIIASGLNFRDVMLAMGLLNDDVLDHGMAGAVYGLECAGKVVAVGDGAPLHKEGDIVLGFCKDGFATHVTAPQESFVVLPAELSPEAGAAIPVAFFTAWYALVELARLKPGERVLIHGGAGSVGLAAIQIARAIGAEVVATVSTPDKEAVARLYGASHVYDSRSRSFADRIEKDLGGVDVVLNSLAGEAMRAGIKCLKPFGRFVELGKRDYVGNTPIGLRPFRRNLSYFGLDVDQLLAIDPATTVQGLQAITAAFAEGKYISLPTLVFEAYEIGNAFRMMQAAGHVGKIVVRPPAVSTCSPAYGNADAYHPGEGVHLIVGGTQGFGLATALWLAERGARRIVVASRSGSIASALLPQVEALRAKGTVFAVETVDVVSADSVDALIARVVNQHGAITAVFHTAMVLDDGLIADLNAERTAAVLAPKIDGARNLDRATRDQPLEHFVLFSSASTLIGNPGQASYVAANGYLQGLARRRRRAGLPALAVGWGAIADVGVLAHRQNTQETLKRIAGVAGMQSKDALEFLGRLLAISPELSDPFVVCAKFQRDEGLGGLRILSTPGFAASFGANGNAGTDTGIDLVAQIGGKSDAEAQRILTRIIAQEVADILRLSVSEVDLDSSLDALGMDSLMALELRMSLETRYSIELPVMSITSVGNLRDLGWRLLRTIRPDEAEEDSPLSAEEQALITIHSNDAGRYEHPPMVASPLPVKRAS